MRFINYFDCLSFNLLGQLLVVARHTDTSPSSCYEPELIPDLFGGIPWCLKRSGISQRAAAARTQRLWRWLV